MLDKSSLLCFAYLGVHPHYPLRKLIIVFNLILTIIVCILLSINLLKVPTIESTESLSIVVLSFTNCLTYILGRNILKRILLDAENFWELDVEDVDTKYMMRHLRISNEVYKYVLTIVSILYVVKPFVLHEKSVLGLYTPPQVPFFVLNCFEVYFGSVLSSSYYTSNSLICTLLISAAAQFRSLNASIKYLNDTKTHKDSRAKKLKRTVKHHQFLIRHVKDINKLLSIPLALYLVEGIGIMCMEMYGLVMGGASLIVRLKICQLSLCMVGQYFYVYGLPAQLLMDQSTDTSNIIYSEMDWYLPHLAPLKRDLLIMTVRSQRGVCLMAASYHLVCNQTILMVLQTAYSFCAFLQTVAET